MGKPHRTGKRGNPLWRTTLLVICVLAQVLPGCTRRFFRNSADKEVTSVIKHKDVFDDWRVENWHVYPDPRARFADPTNPDRPPMPPDDPAAHELSPNPQHPPHRGGIELIKGTGYIDVVSEWDAENRSSDESQGVRLPTLEFKVGASDTQAPPQSAAESRKFLIKLDQAVELGLFNSREYQTRREDLYEAALPVTFERFQFAPHFFALEQGIREQTGAETPEGRHNRWRLDGEAGFTQTFATGAQLLFRFANATVIEMMGGFNPRTISESILTLDLVQPMLRGGGFAVTLEALTQVERDLLYEIRSYAHFRKEFFVSIAGGGALGGGGVPDVIQDVAGVGQTAPAAGFLPTLQRRAFLAIAEQNVAHLRKLFEMYLAFAEGGDLSTSQVDRVKLQLLNGETGILQRRQDYHDSLDAFKLQLGLPTDFPLDLDLSELRSLMKQLQEFVDISNEMKDIRDEVATFRDVPVAQLPGRFRVVLTERPLVKDTTFRTRAVQAWDQVRALPPDALSETLTKLRAQRRELKFVADELARLRPLNQLPTPEQLPALKEFFRVKRQLAAVLAAGATTPWAAPAYAALPPEDPLPAVDQANDPDAFDRALRDLDFRVEVGVFEEMLRHYQAQPWLKMADPELAQGRKQRLFDDLTGQFDGVLIEARNERIDRLTWPTLPASRLGDFDLLAGNEEAALELAGQTALTERLDLMNARAALVDAWRKIAVSANSLLGTLNVAYHMDSFSPLGLARPVDFTGGRTRHQLVLNAELPLVRKLERNVYRRTLIDFQQARRAVMAAEDRVLAEVRRELRQLRVLAENYRIQQNAVDAAYRQVESLIANLQAPPAQGEVGATRYAALTEQLLSALNSLSGAQNTLVGTWVNYHTTRWQLYRDLERMPLDHRGVWIDESAPLQPDAACGLFDRQRPPARGDGPARPGNEDHPQQLPPPRPLASSEK